MRYWMPLFAVLSLAGCKTVDEIYAADDDRVCLGYGVPKGSPAYVECRANLSRNRAIRQTSGGVQSLIVR